MELNGKSRLHFQKSSEKLGGMYFPDWFLNMEKEKE